MNQNIFCALFLALIFTAGAQYSPCTISGTQCTSSQSCTCVIDPTTPNSCTCAERLCSSEAACTAANCAAGCTVGYDASQKVVCQVPCSCQTASGRCGDVKLPSCNTGTLSCVAAASGACEWTTCPTAPTCPDAGKPDVCGTLAKPDCSTGTLTCTTSNTGTCAWSACPNPPTCPDAGKTDVCGTLAKRDCGAGVAPAVCQTSDTGTCVWGSCPTTSTCPDVGKTDVCTGAGAKPVTCSGSVTCKASTAANGQCVWSCPTTSSCGIDPAGLCNGKSRPTTCADKLLSCGVSASGICEWLCSDCHDKVKDTCNSVPRPTGSNTACADGTYTCALSPCGWSPSCPDRCSAAGACPGSATCPSGSTVAQGTEVCLLDPSTGQCAWKAQCVATDPTVGCLSTDGLLCGGVKQPTTCIDRTKSAPVDYKATCNTLTTAASANSGTAVSYQCQWSDNCEASICAPDANGLCGGQRKPETCGPGYYSAANTAQPAFQCTGASATSCQWTSADCRLGCRFDWLASTGVPTCGTTKWPCPTVPVDLPTALFSSQVTAGATTSNVQAASVSLVASLCTQNADSSCSFPQFPCPTQKCIMELRADGAITCGGAVRDPTKLPCASGESLYKTSCVETPGTASGCGWSYTCVKDGVTCFKDSARHTCGGNYVKDTCVPGSTVFTDFSCTDDTKGGCSYGAICTPQTICDTSLDKCLVSATDASIPTTCASTETQVAPAQCCCVAGARSCYITPPKCQPTNPCTTCDYSAAAFDCPTGQKPITRPTCFQNSKGTCELSPAKCATPVDPTCGCNVDTPCPFGQVQKSVKCDTTLCVGIPECVRDTCTGNDPCKCDSSLGCVWVSDKSYCVSKNSFSTSGGSASLGSDYCKPVTDPIDHITDTVSGNTVSQNNLEAAIKAFLADLQLLEKNPCRNGRYCAMDFFVSFFAVVAPKRNSDRSLTVYATLLFTSRDGSALTPTQDHFEHYCSAVKKLLSILSGAFKITDTVSPCAFTVSLKRDALASSSNLVSTGVDVPYSVYSKYISESGSTSVVSGCLIVLSALVALFLF